jgi:hypothetical protein
MQVIETPVHPEQLSWSVRCDKSSAPVATIGITEAAVRGWTFLVSPNCAAQWIELRGRSGEVAQQSDVTIGRLSLSRMSPNGG